MHFYRRFVTMCTFLFVQLILSHIGGPTHAYKVWSCPPWEDDRVIAPVRHGKQCLLHTKSEFTVSWTTAQSFCSQNGGMLAKDDTRERHVLLQKMLASSEGKCSWIGLTSKGTRGKWRWNDGSPLTVKRWGVIESTFSWIHDLAHECGGLCDTFSVELWLLGLSNSDDVWHWIKERCSRKLRLVCQYGAKDKTLTPLLRLNTTPRRRNQTLFITHIRRRLASLENGVLRINQDAVSVDIQVTTYTDAVSVDIQVTTYTETLVIELPAMKDFRLGGSPDWSISARAVTGCARRCKASTPQCLVFNYNKATRQCDGYRAIPTEGCVRAKGWTLWKLIGKKRY